MLWLQLPRFLTAFFALSRTRAPQRGLVKHNLTLTWELGAPNGVSRYMIFTNGQFPSPPIFLDEDDDVEITVCNEMPFNTTIHWHGIEQTNTPWADGVPGLTQKPIEPGEQFVYRWKADIHGTYWYHAHSRTMMQDGLYGALFIRPKVGTPNPLPMISTNTDDLAAMQMAVDNPMLMTISDWDYLTSEKYMEVQRVSNLSIFCVDSILVNGKGSIYCPTQQFLNSQMSPFMNYSLFGVPVTDKGCLPFVESVEGGGFPYDESLLPPGLQANCTPSTGPANETITVNASNGWASLNFIGATGLKWIVFSIDEHPMWVYEVDGQYVQPALYESITMFNGERYSVLIKLDKPAGNYTIRVADTGVSQVISAFATLEYENGEDTGPSKPYINYGGQPIDESVRQLNDSSLSPYPPYPPSQTADETHVLNLGRLDHLWTYTLDGTTIYPSDWQASTPLLHGSPSNFPNSSLILTSKNNTWIDLILQTGWATYEPITAPHVIHKHSSRAWILGSGLGPWNYTSVEHAMQIIPGSFNLVDPPYRDTFVTSLDFGFEDLGATWLAIRYWSHNPGPWLLHCHVETHLEGGMAIVLADGVDVWPTVPEEYLGDNNGFIE